MPRNRVSTARVVELRQNGLTNKEISKILGVSAQTISLRYNEYLRRQENDMGTEDLGTELTDAVEESLPEPKV